MHKQSYDPGIALPITITHIKPQKKRDNRFSLFHEDQFIIGVSADTLTAFNLNKGVVLTRSLLEQISSEEKVIAARDHMMRLLGRRSHSRGELKTKALKKGSSPGQIETVLDELEQKNYLNDEEFARSYASDKLRIRQWGPLKISSELTRKGVDQKTIEKVLSELTDDLELKQICVDLALKRRQHFSREDDHFKRQQKIAAYLQRRGFPYHSIHKALPDISRRIDA